MAGVLSLVLFVSLEGTGLLEVSALGAGSALGSGLLAESSLDTVALLALRLSVIYHPEPLKTMPTGWKTRRTALAHDGQVQSGSSLKDWNCSN